ncbi:MAG: hypothetical protein N2B06_17220 [Clostridium sp.]
MKIIVSILMGSIAVLAVIYGYESSEDKILREAKSPEYVSNAWKRASLHPIILLGSLALGISVTALSYGIIKTIYSTSIADYSFE